MWEEFKAEARRIQERAEAFQDGEDESSAGFAAEPEKEEEEDEEQDIRPSSTATSPFAVETHKKSRFYFLPPIMTNSELSPFSFSSPASADACIESPEVSTPPGLPEASPEEDAVRAARNCSKLRTLSEARTTFLSADSPEVVEGADTAEQLLQTIQDQQEELRRNGEVIKRLAQAINAEFVMAREESVMPPEGPTAETVTLQKEKMKPIPKKKEKCIVKDCQVAVTLRCSAAEPSYRDIIQNQKDEPSRTGEATSEAVWSICDPDSEDDRLGFR